MGSNSSSNSGNSGSDAFVNKKSKVKPVKRDKFGYTVKENPVKKFISGGGVTGAIISGLTNGEEVNRKFFEEKVKPAGKSKYSNYEDYIRARGRGEVDAYGRTVSKSDNGNSNQVVQAPLVATTMPVPGPTEGEVSQAKSTEVKEDDILLRKRKTKAKGRSPTIMTGVTGATGGLTLGKPSLLGM